MIDQIIISARNQKVPGLVAGLIGLLSFAISIYLMSKIIFDLENKVVDTGRIGAFAFGALVCLALTTWIWIIYSTAKEIAVTLYEDHLEVSELHAPISLKNVSASLGESLTFKFDPPDILGAFHVTKQFQSLFQRTGFIQIAVGKMVSQQSADAFLKSFNEQKAKLN